MTTTIEETTVTTDFTTDEVMEAILVATGSDSEYSYNISDFWYDPSWYGLTLRDEDVKPVKVERTGGEDEGSSLSIVFQVGSQFFKKSGYYASHYGSEWDGDFREVRPEIRTVTVYV